MSAKEDLRLYIRVCVIMASLYVVCHLIYNHYLVKDGIIVEAVICRKYTGAHGCQYRDYAYAVNGINFTGTTSHSKNASVNDTIFVVVSAKKHERSRPVSLVQGRAIIFNDINQRVVVNNMSSEEKRELSDRLMSDLRKRYWVKSK